MHAVSKKKFAAGDEPVVELPLLVDLPISCAGSVCAGTAVPSFLLAIQGTSLRGGSVSQPVSHQPVLPAPDARPHHAGSFGSREGK